MLAVPVLCIPNAFVMSCSSTPASAPWPFVRDFQMSWARTDLLELCDKWPVLQSPLPSSGEILDGGKKYALGIRGGTVKLSTGRFIQSVQFKQIPLPECEEISLQTARKGSRNRLCCYLPLQLNFYCFFETWTMFIYLILTSLVKLELPGPCVLKPGY